MNSTEAYGGVSANVSEGQAEWGECDSDRMVTSYEKAFRFVVHGVLLNGIGVCGLIGNALSVVVLSRPRMRSSINCLLIGLAACDTALVITSVLLFGLSAIYPYTGYMRFYYQRLCPRLTPIVYPLAMVAQTMSVYLTLIVTLERWVAVCHPFRARALCTEGRARYYVLGTALFSLLYNAPKFLEAEVYSVPGPLGNDSVLCVTASPFRTDAYVTVYIHWMYLVVMYAVPFAFLAVLNAAIYRQVRRANAERARLSSVQRRELGLATMLLVVVLVFFICNLLPLVTNALESFSGGELAHLDPLVKTSNLLVTTNSGVNFLIYVTFGDKFKRVFLDVFCGGRLRRHGTGGVGVGGRDSPDATRDESFASCGERISLRLVRNGTLRTDDSVRRARSSRRAGGGGGSLIYYPTGSCPRRQPSDVTICTGLSPVPSPAHSLVPSQAEEAGAGNGDF